MSTVANEAQQEEGGRSWAKLGARAAQPGPKRMPREVSKASPPSTTAKFLRRLCGKETERRTLLPPYHTNFTEFLSNAVDDEYRSMDEFDVTSTDSSYAGSIAAAGVGGCMRVRSQGQSLAHKYRTSTPSSEKKGVSWGTIEIKTHKAVLGDNPSVSVGPPLGIDWEVLCTQSLALDEYEEHRSERRGSGSLRMPRRERERLLMEDCGYARSDLKEATEQVNKIKQLRISSAKKSSWEVLRRAFGKQKRRMIVAKKIDEES